MYDSDDALDEGNTRSNGKIGHRIADENIAEVKRNQIDACHAKNAHGGETTPPPVDSSGPRSTWPDNASRSRGNRMMHIVIHAVLRLSCHVSCDNHEPIFAFMGRRPRIPTCNTRTLVNPYRFRNEKPLYRLFFQSLCINRDIDHA